MGITMVITNIFGFVWVIVMLMIALWSWTQYKVVEKKVELTNEMIRNEESKYR